MSEAANVYKMSTLVVPMLEVSNVAVGYGDRDVLDGVSFRIKHGQCVAVLGRNGAGKTTLLRTILGYNQLRRGQIRVGGRALERKPTYRIARLGLAYVPDNRGIFANLTVREHLALSRRAGHKRILKADFESIYEMFPILTKRASSYGGHLSGGEQQMLAIARSLIGGPKLILLDEPSQGLAPLIVDQITDVLRKILKGGTSVLLVEQNYDMVTALADHVHVLGKGNMQFGGTVAELEDADGIRKTYLGIS